MGKSLQDLTDEIREINVSKGWRPAEGGPGDRTFGDFIALLHSEVSEALDAYRDHKLADATAGPDWANADDDPEDGPTSLDHNPKPEGVGSELADVLIRLLDMCDVFGIKPFDMDCELADVSGALLVPVGGLNGFGDHLALLHFQISAAWLPPGNEWPSVLRTLVAVAEKYEIDLTAEVERKIAYNRTREFRHGGRHL